MRKTPFVAAAALALVMSPRAEAHAFLVKSDPAVGASVAAPKTLKLEFSEGIELALSGVDVSTPAGAAVPAQKAHYDGADRKVLLSELPALAPGAYKVKWHVVSADTHKTEGDFTFTVK